MFSTNPLARGEKKGYAHGEKGRECQENQVQEESKSALEVIIRKGARLCTGCISVPPI